jgi:hypothetical protein
MREHVRTYHYLVENYREKGRVRQRTLAYLGKYPSVEEALIGLPKDIESWQKSLPRAYQKRDEAKAAYEKELARFSKPFVFDESMWHRSQHSQERLHWEERQPQGYRWKLLRTANNKYQEWEGHLSWVQKRLTELQARLAKLQALSNPDGSDHRSPSEQTFVGTTAV